MDDNHRGKFYSRMTYSISAVEYLGLVSKSLMVKGNRSLKKFGWAAIDGVTAPFARIKKRSVSNKKLYSTPYDILHLDHPALRNGNKLSDLEASISRLEERLAQLEKRGIAISGNHQKQPETAEKEKKEINEEKRAILRMLVNENKQLRKMAEN
ncbi:Putative DNA-binding protein [Desulfamplus magnetovallimortis]|uniref:Putative DNA-binding protein n=1 Tax=Desulfamplus magnetovallimortis TaxID=1246637 RepID=L0R3W8_9BACT|nr:hypothetical protein [Desulfamplus magnetovallimortis]CCO06693.1 Putative DNA-binding protein [Desulfamplus magnetovallimortis BW-1]SLM32744.1 Putative DNA-binding protein [Desulfamplus magnetovallimortis]